MKILTHNLKTQEKRNKEIKHRRNKGIKHALYRQETNRNYGRIEPNHISIYISESKLKNFKERADVVGLDIKQGLITGCQQETVKNKVKLIIRRKKRV